MTINTASAEINNYKPYKMELVGTDYWELKGNYSIIMLLEDLFLDGQFLTMLDKNNLQLKKSLLCNIRLREGSNNWISEKSAIKIKNEIEINEKVLTLNFDCINSGYSFFIHSFN